ncbi:MAG: 50S ribosomal protein L24 [Propionibacteriaceae bacterium]|jgi:large subunit ribosomal protein L24|nr:50S ribosomal protein L24 [Propionibacteriaceae bacterium]
MAMSIKNHDRVIVIAGKDKGKTGEVIAVSPADQTVTVAGVNIVKRHRKDRSDGTGRQVVKGGILSSEAPIHVSNVALVVREKGHDVATRVGFKRVETTRKHADGTSYTVTRSVRVAKKTGEEI